MREADGLKGKKMKVYDTRVPRLLFPFGLMQLFCRITSLKGHSTTFCRLLSM